MKPLLVLAISLTGCTINMENPASDDSTNTTETTTAVSTATNTTSTTSASVVTVVDTSATTAMDETTVVSVDSSSSGGFALDGEYGDCSAKMPCTAQEFCITDGSRNVCGALPCSSDNDCPVHNLPDSVPPSATPATPICTNLGGNDVCVLTCGVSADCPEGMTCVDAGVPLCMWPPPSPGGGMCPDEDLGSATPTVVVGTTVGNTDDVYRTCGFESGSDDQLLWTAPVDGTFRFDTDGTQADFGNDTVISILDGCGGTEIACADDLDDLGTADSAVEVELVAGQAVIVVVDSYMGGGTGDYNLTISVVP